jgi:hypothetical protein
MLLTIQETGKAEQSIPDDTVLALATADRRAVMTINRKQTTQLSGQLLRINRP